MIWCPFASHMSIHRTSRPSWLVKTCLSYSNMWLTWSLPVNHRMKWQRKLNNIIHRLQANVTRKFCHYRTKLRWKRADTEKRQPMRFALKLWNSTTFQICSLNACMPNANHLGRSLSGCAQARINTVMTSLNPCSRLTSRSLRLAHQMKSNVSASLKDRS